MNIPIELFSLFIGTSIALGLFGFLRNPQVPALMTFAGIFILFIAVMTTTIQLDAFSNGSSPTIQHYDIISSTGQASLHNGGLVATGERLSTSSSILLGDTIDCITVFLGRSGSPAISAPIEIGVMDSSTTFIKQFGIMNVTQLVTNSVQPYDICLPIGDTYTFNSDNQIVGIKYNGGSAGNQVNVRIDANNPFDGSDTERVSSNTGSSWFADTGQDMMMIMSLRGTSGQIIYDSFEFTEMPKVIFSLLGAIFMLSGALMVFKGQS